MIITGGVSILLSVLVWFQYPSNPAEATFWVARILKPDKNRKKDRDTPRNNHEQLPGQDGAMAPKALGAAESVVVPAMEVTIGMFFNRYEQSFLQPFLHRAPVAKPQERRRSWRHNEVVG
jgi:hypothetical protein